MRNVEDRSRAATREGGGQCIVGECSNSLYTGSGSALRKVMATWSAARRGSRRRRDRIAVGELRRGSAMNPCAAARVRYRQRPLRVDPRMTAGIFFRRPGGRCGAANGGRASPSARRAGRSQRPRIESGKPTLAWWREIVWRRRMKDRDAVRCSACGSVSATTEKRAEIESQSSSSAADRPHAAGVLSAGGRTCDRSATAAGCAAARRPARGPASDATNYVLSLDARQATSRIPRPPPGREKR